MVFVSNVRVTFTKATIIVNVCLIQILWGVAVSGMNCCADLDIQLTVECVNGVTLLNWRTRNVPVFGFDVNYGCSSNVNCSGGTKIPLKKSELVSNEIGDGAHIFATNISNTNFGNSMCWFWVKNKDELNNNEGCSAVVTCNPVMSSFSILSSYPSSMEVLPTATATTTLYTATPTINIVTFSVTSTTTLSTVTVMATPTSTVTNTNTTYTAIINTPEFATIASVFPSSSVRASFEPQQNTFQDFYSLMIYIILCCAAIIILLLVSIFLFAYWRKRKRRQLENYHIEDVCCEDPGELAKESDSETETLANGNGIGDDISITEDDMYMLRKILRLDILSLDPSIFTDNEADDGSVASHYRTDDGSVECSHYCGSGGHCLQSNASSSQHRSSSCSSVF